VFACTTAMRSLDRGLEKITDNLNENINEYDIMMGNRTTLARSLNLQIHKKSKFKHLETVDTVLDNVYGWFTNRTKKADNDEINLKAREEEALTELNNMGDINYILKNIFSNIKILPSTRTELINKLRATTNKEFEYEQMNIEKCMNEIRILNSKLGLNKNHMEKLEQKIKYEQEETKKWIERVKKKKNTKKIIQIFIFNYHIFIIIIILFF
jgi:flagellin-like hook-associated protein FlgL